MNKINFRLYEHVEEVGNKLLKLGLSEEKLYTFDGIYLCGSQNYNTHHEGSDIDSKLIVLPTAESLIRGTRLNYDIDMENGEKVSVKPLGQFIDLFWKGNINNLEILTTKHKICSNFIERMKQEGCAESIPKLVQGTLWDASIGMMLQKQKSMFTGTATTKPYLDECGFDNKDVIHILRIHALLQGLYKEQGFEESLDFSKHPSATLMNDIRAKRVTKHIATNLAESMISSAKFMKNDLNPKNDVAGIEAARQSWMNEYVDYVKETLL